MKKRIVAAVLAAFFMFPLFGTVAYAGGGDCTEPPVEAPAPEPAPENPATEYPVEPAVEEKPFTSDGTAAVIDNTTDADGKEFFTIMTLAENVFYLIIDRQRETENVYFLNAVTESDLMALAEISPAPEPAPKKSGGGRMIFIVVLVLLGGGAGWYFKIYRPKQQQADTENDFEYSEETELYSEDDLYGEDDGGGDYDGYGGDPDSGEWDAEADPP